MHRPRPCAPSPATHPVALAACRCSLPAPSGAVPPPPSSEAPRQAGRRRSGLTCLDRARLDSSARS
eukprot:768683-Hanusia_phi.AAC.10